MSQSQLRAQVDKLLTNVSTGYFPDGYISENVFPKLQVKQKTGLIGRYGQDHLRLVNSVVAGKGKARRVETITRTSDSYSIDNHALESLVTPDDYANVEQPFDAEQDEVLGVTTVLWLEKEVGLSSQLGSTSVLTQNTTLSGTAQFNDFANSDPIGKFLTARETIRNACGVAPDTAIMDWSVSNRLAYHPAILEALGYTFQRAGQLSEAELAKAMGVKRLLIAQPMYNTAAQGQTDSLSSCWGKNIIFGVLPPTASKYQKTLGYYVTPTGSQPRKVYKTAVNNPPESTEIIVTDNYDYVIVDVKAGYLIKNAVA